jgi:hypothetical protein
MTRFPPPTKLPNTSTTCPGSPVERISLVDETLSEILKMVVNKSSVGKPDISSVSFAKRQLKTIKRAILILNKIRKSSIHDFIGIMKNITAAKRYIATNISFLLFFFFIMSPPVTDISCIYIHPANIYAGIKTSLR